VTIESYLDTLCLELQGRMPDSVADERLFELETHLHMAEANYQSQGLEIQEATHRAILDLGSARVVSDDLVRQHMGYGLRSKWSLIRWFAPIMFFGLSAPFLVQLVVNFFTPQSYQWVDPICGVGCWVSLVCFGLLIWRTRRWLAAPIAGWSCPLTVLAIFVLAFIGMPPGHLAARDWQELRSGAAELLKAEQPQIEAMNEWERGDPPTDEGPTAERVSTEVNIPFFPLPWIRTSYSYELKPMNGADSRQAWAIYGAAYAEDLEQYMRVFSAPARPTSDSGPYQFRMAWDYCRKIAGSMAVGVALLFAWNAVFLALARLTDGLRNEKLRNHLSSTVVR
jgi:hypothetical protein